MLKFGRGPDVQNSTTLLWEGKLSSPPVEMERSPSGRMRGLTLPPHSQGLGAHPFGAEDESLGQFPALGMDGPGTAGQAKPCQALTAVPAHPWRKQSFHLLTPNGPARAVTLRCRLESDRPPIFKTLQIFNRRTTCTWLET